MAISLPRRTTSSLRGAKERNDGFDEHRIEHDLAPAVEFSEVSKRFILQHDRPRSFQELAISFLKGNGRREEFWALRDISFAVPRGQSIAVIGQNGAGKSTLLKLIARILEPTDGRLTVNGRVSALLELGAGFHPDLTGRENIYLYSSILGLSRREIVQRFNAIVTFAEMERFIDVPVKYYSSGMYVRLGFAVAIHVDPDILLIDEVLAVGDEAFQQRCLDAIHRFRLQGKTIVFVSHDLAAVQNLCDRVIWLEKGRIHEEGPAYEVIDRYLRYVHRKEQADFPPASFPNERGDGGETGELRKRWGTREVEITGVRFLDGSGRERQIFFTSEPLTARIHYKAHRRIEQPVFGVAVYRSDGLHVSGPNTRFSGYPIEHIEGEGEIDYTIVSLPLLEGTYEFSVACYDQMLQHAYDHQHRLYTFRVRTGRLHERFGLIYTPCRWEHRPLAVDHPVKV